jgi:hypothetical protein
MAPEIPYNKKQKPDIEDKIDAAIMTFCALSLVAVFSTIMWAIIIGLWHAGLIKTVVIVGVFSGLFAIGRAVYHTILEKDFS